MFKEPNVGMTEKQENKDKCGHQCHTGCSLMMAVAGNGTTALPDSASPPPPLNTTAYINRVLREKIPAISH